MLDYTICIPEHLEIAPAAARVPAGFGEYEGFSPENFDAYQSAQKTHTLVVTILIGIASAGIIVASILIPGVVFVAPFALIGLAVIEAKTLSRHWAVHNHFPPSLIEGMNSARRVGEMIQENGSALVLADGPEIKKYKLDLIRSAESSIFMSSYMGKEALDEALDLIEEQMSRKPALKVFILGSTFFLTSSNEEKFDQLKKAYPDRFFTVLHPEVYHSQHPQGGSPLITTNHIKLLSIDQGVYSLIGGSALLPFWTEVTGTEHLERLNDNHAIFQNPIAAKGFRDMDFVFKSVGQEGMGATAFMEAAKLMVRYAHMQDPASAKKLKEVLMEVARRPFAMATSVPSMDSRQDLVRQAGIKLYSSGPDHLQNSFTNALIDHFDNAQRKIVIAHMYFHPPQKLVDAIARAAKRGVQIEIINNSVDQEAPLAHGSFVELAKATYRQLFLQEGHENIKVREFYRANTTYHKKVLVVDDRYTALGSSNFGAKSLEDNAADYELNAIVDSAGFAAATSQVLQKDRELSIEVPTEKIINIGWTTRLAAFFQQQIMAQVL